MRKTNDAGVQLIKEFEGLELTAYRDSVGVLTIGYGHTGSDVKRGQVITEDEAERLLREDLRDAEQAVENAVDVALRDNQFAALVSFTFNLGEGALRRSTLVRKLNRGEHTGAAEEILKWDKAGKPPKRLAGLTRRRKAERKLFLTPDKPILNGGTEPALAAESTEVIKTTTVEKTAEGTETKETTFVEKIAGNEQVKTIASEGVSKLATKAIGTLGTAGTGAAAGAATSSNPWPWIVLAIVCLLLAGGVVYFLMKHKSNKETKVAEINSDKDRTDVLFAKK